VDTTYTNLRIALNSFLQKHSFWKVLIFLLNGFVFVLIGLQLPGILSIKELGRYSVPALLGYGLALSGVVLLVRFVWIFSLDYGAYLWRRWRYPFSPIAATPWPELAVLSWAGMRGVVSLATALALPLTLAGERLFPQHSLILFLTFFVIVTSLLAQGLTLPWLVRHLHLQAPQAQAATEEQQLRVALARYSLTFIDKQLPPDTPDHVVQELKRAFSYGTNSTVSSCPFFPEPPTPFQQMLGKHLLVVKAQRELLVELQEAGDFEEALVHKLEQELDIALLALRLRVENGQVALATL